MLFITLPLTFDRFHHDIIVCCMTLVLKVVKEIATVK